MNSQPESSHTRHPARLDLPEHMSACYALHITTTTIPVDKSTLAFLVPLR